MGVERMTGDSSAPRRSSSQSPSEENGEGVRSTQFAEVSESSTAHVIVSAAMVGHLGGGPRLAIRAARVVLEDGHGSRLRARPGRLRGRIRRRGD
jgi:hypothetical protein